MAPRCDLIIPVWNLLEKTKECLESILENTSLSYRFILIDNGSEEPTRSFLERFKEKAPSPVTLIRNEENRGYVKAINQGIGLSEAPYVCILNNDTIVFPGWLERMIRAAESRPEIGIVNPGSNSLGFRKPWYQSWRAFAEEVTRREAGRVFEIATGTGFCLLIKRALIERIGGWSEDYGRGYYEDTDYCRRAAEAGFLTVHARDAFVYHDEHSSFGRGKSARRRITASNRERFEHRFGKPRRIAFCLRHPAEALAEWVEGEALRLARAYNWIWIFSEGSNPFFHSPQHGNIKWVELPSPFFSWNCLFQILKKKKRFDLIYSNEPELIRRLQKSRTIHRAELHDLGRRNPVAYQTSPS